MWVGGCVTIPAMWASPPVRRGPHRQGDGRRSVHKSAEMASRCRFGAFVYTVAPWAWVVGGLGIAIVYTNGRIGPLRTGLGHLCTLLGCCAVVDRREDAIVYTDRRKRPLRTGLGHLCTLLGLARKCERPWGRRSVHKSVEMAPSEPFWGICVHCCDASRDTELRRELRQVARAPQPPWRAGASSSLAPPAWSGRQALSEWRRCQVGIFAKASTHANP